MRISTATASDARLQEAGRYDILPPIQYKLRDDLLQSFTFTIGGVDGHRTQDAPESGSGSLAGVKDRKLTVSLNTGSRYQARPDGEAISSAWRPSAGSASWAWP